MAQTKIAIIGGGNLGGSIAEGLIKSGHTQAQDIIITRRQPNRLQSLQEKGVITTSDNVLAVEKSDIIIIAVKPFNVADVLKNLKSFIDPKRHVVVSVATGISIADFAAQLPAQVALFRAAPNTAVSIQESITCLCHANATDAQIQFITNLFDQLGKTILIDEQMMDAATVLGACGIAYALRFARAAIQGGIEIGFDAKSANLITAQVVKGAAELLLKLGRHPEEEIDRVTTPKGYTITGLNEMEHQGFSSAVIKGIYASYKKMKP